MDNKNGLWDIKKRNLIESICFESKAYTKSKMEKSIIL